MSKARTHDMPEGKLGSLIEGLGPLNNRWRAGEPSEKVLTLWEMGDTLLKSVPEPLDFLLWEIQKRSYITRNLLRYALIIRRSWENQSELQRLVQGLRNYTVFREALPFLKGKREGIDEVTYNKVVTLLRNTDTRKAIQYLKKLKARKIGRQHKKGASVAAVRDQAVGFSQALAQLEEGVTDLKVGSVAPDGVLIALSRAAMSIATGEELRALPVAAPIDNSNLSVVASSLEAIARGGRTTAAAFRKAVGAETLMQAADLLNSMRSERALAEWRRRRGATVSFGTQKNRPGEIL